MNKKGAIFVTASTVLIIVAIGSFLSGLSMGQRSMLSISASGLDNAQVTLLFGRIEDERHFSDLVKRGCVKSATEFAEYTTDADMQILHQFISKDKIHDTLSDIRNKDPELLKEAASYSPRFPNPWQERACN